MSFIGEIQARLSADNSDFKSKLKDADSTVQQWGRSVSGLGNRLGSTVGRVGQLASRFGAVGAAIAGVVLVGKQLVDRLEESRDGVDENVDASKRLVAGVSGVGSVLKEMKNQVLDVGIGLIGGITRSAEWLVKQTAMGRELLAEAETLRGIERQTAETLRTIDLQRKVVEEVNRLKSQTAEVERKAAELAQKQLDIGTQIAVQTAKVQAARDALARSEGDRIASAKAELLIAQERSELEKLYVQQAKEKAEEEKKAAQQAQQARDRHVETLEEIQRLKFEALPLEEKILTYTDSIANLERLIADGKKEGANVDEYVLALMENQSELARLRALQTKEVSKEEEVLLALSKEQLKAQGSIVEAAIVEAKTRGASTEELEKQLKIIRQILGVAEEVERTTIRISRAGKNYEDQSTDSLKGVLRRNKSNLQRINEQEFQTGFDSPFDTLLGAEIRRIESELTGRASVGAYAERYGENAARRQFGDTATDQALRDQADGITRASRALESIEQRMKNSGLFPAGGPSPTG